MSVTANSNKMLGRIFSAGGSLDLWPDHAESHALRALENRKLVFCDDTKMQERGHGKGGGLIYTLTDEGRIAAQLTAPKTERTP